jgi:2-polyprenyl-3-methyl-5-hydroxy-6-metoxy-1,4-benzoquinol methylase
MNRFRSSSDAVKAALQLGGDPARLRPFYEGWADDYDHDVAEEAYVGPHVTVEMLSAVGVDPDPDLQLLDAGCGTGLVGRRLHGLGFRNVDGFDLSAGMVEVAARSGAYRHLKSDVDLNHPLLGYPPRSYDVVLCCGVLGHVPPRSLAHLIRPGKPGGRLLVSTRTAYCQEQGYEQASEELVARGLLTLLLRIEDAPYTSDSRAHYWAYRINEIAE